MLKWLKRRRDKPTRPTWRQYYLVYTKEAKPPEWAQALTADSAIRGSFVTRDENPDMFLAMPPARSSESEDDVLAGCSGAVELGAQYERDEKTFVEVARFACQMAAREAGYVTSVGAFATYAAAAWLDRLDEFAVENFIGIHTVPEGEGGTTFWLHSHGLKQFELPELEVRGVPPDLVEATGGFINGMGEWMLAGEAFADGHTMECPGVGSVWAVCESIRAAENEDHGEPDYALLRLSDYDPETGQRAHGLTRFLRAMAAGSG